MNIDSELYRFEWRLSIPLFYVVSQPPILFVCLFKGWGGWLLDRYSKWELRDFLISMFSLLFSLSGMGVAMQVSGELIICSPKMSHTFVICVCITLRYVCFSVSPFFLCRVSPTEERPTMLQNVSLI